MVEGSYAHPARPASGRQQAPLPGGGQPRPQSSRPTSAKAAPAPAPLKPPPQAPAREPVKPPPPAPVRESVKPPPLAPAPKPVPAAPPPITRRSLAARQFPAAKPSISDAVADSLSSTDDLLARMRMASYGRQKDPSPAAQVPVKRHSVADAAPREKVASLRVRPLSARTARVVRGSYGGAPALGGNAAEGEAPSAFASKLMSAVSILDGAAGEYKKKMGREEGKPGLLAMFQCRKFRVGRLETSYPSAVDFFPDRVEYWFQHPDHKKVKMVMWYADMSDVALSPARAGKGSLSFRINRPLEYFTAQYDASNPADRLSIGIDSAEDLRRLERHVMRSLPAR